MIDEVIKLNFNITKELLEAMPEEDYEVFERIQDGEPLRLYRFRPLVANFLRGENNQPITYAAALKLLGKIPVGKWEGVAKQFTDALMELAVPNASGGNSKPPLEANTPASASPAGSQE